MKNTWKRGTFSSYMVLQVRRCLRLRVQEAAPGRAQRGAGGRCRPVPRPALLTPARAALSPQLCRAARPPSAAAAEALEAPAVEAPAAAAPAGAAATEGAPEGPVEVVTRVAAAGATEGAAGAAASTGAEAAAARPACRSSRPPPTLPTSESWSREKLTQPRRQGALLSPPRRPF